MDACTIVLSSFCFVVCFEGLFVCLFVCLFVLFVRMLVCLFVLFVCFVVTPASQQWMLAQLYCRRSLLLFALKVCLFAHLLTCVFCLRPLTQQWMHGCIVVVLFCCLLEGQLGCSLVCLFVLLFVCLCVVTSPQWMLA